MTLLQLLQALPIEALHLGESVIVRVSVGIAVLLPSGAAALKILRSTKWSGDGNGKLARLEERVEGLCEDVDRIGGEVDKTRDEIARARSDATAMNAETRGSVSRVHERIDRFLFEKRGGAA